MKVGHWVYISGPTTDTVHLVGFTDLMVAESRDYVTLAGRALRTLCGKPVNENWIEGDETLSGVAATCGRCLRSIGRQPLDTDNARV